MKAIPKKLNNLKNCHGNTTVFKKPPKDSLQGLTFLFPGYLWMTYE